MKKRWVVAAAAGGAVLWWLDDILAEVEVHRSRLSEIEEDLARLSPTQLQTWADDVNEHIVKMRDRLDAIESGSNIEHVLEVFASRFLAARAQRASRPEGEPPGPSTVRGFPDPPSGGHGDPRPGNEERHVEPR